MSWISNKSLIWCACVGRIWMSVQIHTQLIICYILLDYKVTLLLYSGFSWKWIVDLLCLFHQSVSLATKSCRITICLPPLQCWLESCSDNKKWLRVFAQYWYVSAFVCLFSTDMLEGLLVFCHRLLVFSWSAYWLLQ